MTQAGVDIFECHVDDHKTLEEIAHMKHPLFGGNVSVRAEPREKTIILFLIR